MSTPNKKRYALVGTGGRATMFIDPIATRFSGDSELVGLCDTNPGRLAYHNHRLSTELGYQELPTYPATNFDSMVRETEPDTVIVTTVDAFHHQYIIRAMELGCDAITEKPMTTDTNKCRSIFDAINRTGKHLRVAFNYRWSSGPTTVRRLISDGTIGEVLHVDMEYWLNTHHGGDYFRRWHREKDRSGGLMVHKATHHFDLVNWWIDAVPETVFGMGRLAFYGRANAERRGVQVAHDRYHGSGSVEDPFAIDLTHDEKLRGLYLESEKYDGYLRDRNVFGDGITIEDSMSALIRYRTGTVLNYSLNAYLPIEGYSVSFNGTEGRIDFTERREATSIAGPKSVTRPEHPERNHQLMVRPMFKDPYEIEIPAGASGGHGGADPMLQEQIFSANPSPDPWGRDAEHAQGAASVLIGIAANQTFETGTPVEISNLFPELGDAKRLSELP